MKSWKIPPKNASVAKYIDCYWFLEKSQGDVSPAYPKLNPDPAGHLILTKPYQAYRYENTSMLEVGQGSHLILPHQHTICIDHSQPFLILGIKFRVGALYSLKLPTAQPLLDKIIAIDEKLIFHLTLSRVGSLFNQASDQAQLCRDILDNMLVPYLSTIDEDRHTSLMRRALDILPETPISGIGAALACSQRTIERSFLRVSGFTLKQYQSMEKLEAILHYLHELNERHIRWVDVALQFGFSDQPHLVRYLKSTIGNTPGQYLKQRDLTIDAYGNFE